MIAAGIALIASFFLAGRLDSTATNSDDPGGFNVPKLETTQQDGANAGPEDKTLKLTVPAMSRIEDDEIPYATGGDEIEAEELRRHPPRRHRLPRGTMRRTSTSPATASAIPTPRVG